MNEYQLGTLAERAMRQAHRVRYEDAPRGDMDVVARAWERLADSAFALRAIYAVRATYDPKRVPPPLSDDPPDDQRPQFHG